MTANRPHLRNLLLLLTLIGLSLLLSACGSPEEAVLPTEAVAASLPNPAATPTLAAPGLADTAGSQPSANRARTIGDPYAPELGNQGYFVQHYTIRLRLDPSTPFIYGVVTIEAISNQPGLREIALDFVGFDVTALTVDSQVATHFRDGPKLVVSLPATYGAATPFRLDIAYEGEPLRQQSPYMSVLNHLGLTYPGNNAIYAFNEPDGARFWFPGNDHPRDKATFRFEITAPLGLTAVANGNLRTRYEQPLPSGRAGETFIWEHSFPMATYLAQVAVGDFVEITGTSPGGVPLRHFVQPHLVTAFQPLADISGDAIDWMSGLFGPYPFEAFGYVTAAAPSFSLETQTTVLLSDQMLFESIAIHEMSHMWFGNWVSLYSWSDMWRNEGFATYIEAVWATNDNPATLDAYMESVRIQANANSTGYDLDELPPEFLFSSDSYNKGAVMIHDLRRVVGDDAFFRGLRLYFQTYGGSTATQADFRQVMAAAAGYPLDNFFEPWLGD